MLAHGWVSGRLDGQFSQINAPPESTQRSGTRNLPSGPPFRRRMRVVCLLLMLAAWLGAGPTPNQAHGQVAQDPEISAQRLLVRGMTRSFLGDDEGALELFERILQFRPDDATVHAAIATTLVSLDDFVRASFYAERAATLAPERGENIRLVAELREISGDAIGSLEAYDNLITLLPDDLAARVAKARLLIALEQRTAARDTYSEALSLGAKPGEILQEYLDVLIDLGELESALATAQALRDLSGGAEVVGTIGQILVRLGRDGEAADVFASGLDEWPNDAEIYDALAALDPDRAASYRQSSGTPDEIAAALAREAETDVRSIELRLRALKANLLVRDLPTAMRLADEGTLFFPGDRELILLAVDAYLHGLEPQKAIELLQAAAHLAEGDPDWPRVTLAGRGAAEWVLSGSVSEVESPGDPRALSWSVMAGADREMLTGVTSRALARALMAARRGRAAEAVTILTESTSGNGASPLEWVALGDFLDGDGRTTEALSAWRRALEMAPSNAIVLSRLRLP